MVGAKRTSANVRKGLDYLTYLGASRDGMWKDSSLTYKNFGGGGG